MCKNHAENVKTMFSRLFKNTQNEIVSPIYNPHGTKPLPKKVEAISCILSPKIQKQLRRFLGMDN